MEKKIDLVDLENQELRVYDVAENEKFFDVDGKKPSARIFQTKQGRQAINGLKIIEEKYNMSWYGVLKAKMPGFEDKEAIFYRGRSITTREMFETADTWAQSLAQLGIKKGDMIACCITDCPELIYLMLGANKIGAKLNLFTEAYAREYIDIIVHDCSDKLFIGTDNTYGVIRDIIEARGFAKKLIISLADSLPEDPASCEGYEPTLAKYYVYENKAAEFAKSDDTIILVPEFIELSYFFEGEVIDDNDLDTDFLVTYTSGSTSKGFPKQMYHRNRSPITIGIFHDPELCGNPPVKGFRSMVHMHTDTNTNNITCISDSLFQHWAMAMEPEYGRETFLDTCFINKPNMTTATTTILLSAAKQYLLEKKFMVNGKYRKMTWITAFMAVGEACTKGEEKFINKWFKVAKAGKDIPLIGPFKLPVITVGVGGGDTEHGGIYYTLFRAMYEKLNARKLHGGELGMAPVPYVQVTVLKKNDDGTYTECDYNEPGIIVANGATTFRRYKDFSKVLEKVITDDQGRDWISCDTFGFIDDVGSVHMKDRKDALIKFSDGSSVMPYQVIEVAQEDSNSIMTSFITQVGEGDDMKLVLNLELSPYCELDKDTVLQYLDKRIDETFPEVCDKLVYRMFDDDHEVPYAPSGKRDFVKVAAMGLERTIAL